MKTTRWEWSPGTMSNTRNDCSTFLWYIAQVYDRILGNLRSKGPIFERCNIGVWPRDIVKRLKRALVCIHTILFLYYLIVDISVMLWWDIWHDKGSGLEGSLQRLMDRISGHCCKRGQYQRPEDRKLSRSYPLRWPLSSLSRYDRFSPVLSPQTE